MYEGVEMMRKHIVYILLLFAGLSFVAGCNKMEDEFSFDNISDRSLISPYCEIGEVPAVNYASGEMPTRALINQQTSTDTILCNFLRVDEGDNSTFAKWNDAYVSEGTIATIPDIQNNKLRAISLYPNQAYPDAEGKSSRMVGWYPRNCNIPENTEGETAAIKFSDAEYDNVQVKGENYVGVKFTGLDGSVDVMVSDVRDGSKSNPFDSDNFFTFKHYLSAVRIYAKAERSSQDVGMWGEISEVTIIDQPTSCIVALPETPSGTGESTGFGSVVDWGDETASFDIRKEYLFGNKESGNPENLKAEEYPIALSGLSVEKYLGYSLIKPNSDLKIQVHTSAGVYNVVLPADSPIFNAGYIYDIHLDFRTDGTIFTYLETEGSERYFDLTKGVELDIDSDGDGDVDADDSNIYENKYSNCYIVKSNPSGTNEDPIYDGFCFDATVVGNGDMGILSNGAQTFYPTNAHINPYSADVLWETSPRLITNVELLYGFVRFKVARNTDASGNFVSFKEGNAVIAVYNREGKVLWSWHIWITDMPQDISYTEGTTTITIMDRNVGATYGGKPANTVDALASYGLYYQWGRKDPSMGPPSWDYYPINMITAPYYDYSSDVYYSAEVVRKPAPTLQDAVENPMYLIMPTSQTQTYYFNWLYEKIDFLWGYDPSDGTTRKTIYDPCPYGYRVSGGELGDLFAYATSLGTTSSYDLSTYGQTVKVPANGPSSANVEIFFPYSGYKGVDRGLNSLVSSWKYVGQKGDYQSAIVDDYADNPEYYMHRSRIYLSKATSWNELNVGSYTGHQIEDHTNRRTAAPVRCVRNEEHRRVQAFITPDRHSVSANNDVVNFTLYAKSFGSNLSTAKLYIAYHPKTDDGGEGEHREVLIYNNDNIGNQNWSYPFSYDFNDLKHNGEVVDLSTTTGSFRFLLEVKSVDNINRISSTTITLAHNYIGFDNWLVDNTIYVGQPVSREFRLYGDSKPVNVQMIVDGNDSSPVDISSNLDPIDGSSEYLYDYLCSTGEFSFSEKGSHYVYFKVTYEDGTTITYNSDDNKKLFEVKGITLNKVESVSYISDQSMYVIQNVGTDTYIFDNGNNLYSKSSGDYECFFKITVTNNTYKIQNVYSGDYINRSWGSSLYVNVTNANSATGFTISSANNGEFRISNNNYNWVLLNANSNVSTNRNTTGNTTWVIYEVSVDND